MLYCGDNLDILRQHIADESVDLVYLDPPFKSNRDYKVLEAKKRGTGAPANVTAFEDTWQWHDETEAAYSEIVQLGGAVSGATRAFRQLLGDSDMMAYLTMMAPRLVEIRRSLRPSGSMYLHCDPRTSHYLKVLLDATFGTENYRNEIVWFYGGRGAKAIAKQFPRNHDVILFYSKRKGLQTYSRQFINRTYTPLQARQRGLRQDDSGRWFKTAPRGDYTDVSVARLEAEGRIYSTRTGRIRVKYFLHMEGQAIVEDALLGDTWTDIPDAMHIGKERIGYPTQKPEALLERIISSCRGDVVLDPFCGSGTTIAVAERLGRRWIGIDTSHVAINLVKARLEDAHGGSASYRIIRAPAAV